MANPTVLVTGASGFVGRAVVAQILRDGRETPRAAVRRDAAAPSGAEIARVGDLDANTDWSSSLRGARMVVHCAARVHVMRESAADPLKEFRRVNVAGSAALAKQAAAAGVERFVFLSSIKVNGEETAQGAPFTADDLPAPLDPYGVSKLEAELALRDVAATTPMTVAIIRPVLVHGPGVKGNFLTMMKLLAMGIPLPFGAVDNRRSLVALDNLCDLVVTCARHPAAANKTFLVSDGEDLSTAALLRRLAASLDKPARLVPVPASLLNIAATVVGAGSIARRVLGSLQVDISSTRSALGWSPPVGVDAGLRAAAEDFLRRRSPGAG
ncbi:MAG: NAD-dependent epimerase/dehydratase family protein [Gemmatimonadetes bacterium]|nr:NAD-dependent epimerase/dehydratase family protein [Gemmatimonadota bacterium]